MSNLLSMALLAIEDDDAIVVFGDALEEAGLRGLPWKEMWHLMIGNPRQAEGRRGFARALASAMLFEHWPTSWPLADRCDDWVTYRIKGQPGWHGPDLRRNAMRAFYVDEMYPSPPLQRQSDGRPEKA